MHTQYLVSRVDDEDDNAVGSRKDAKDGPSSSLHLSKLINLCYDTLTNRYFLACFVYFIYAVGSMLNNIYNESNIRVLNELYFRYNVLHLVNALMFAWSWKGKRYTDVELIPEYLNIIGATLYITSSCYYNQMYTTDDDAAGYTNYFYVTRQLEIVAGGTEVLAAIGWILVWYFNFTSDCGSLCDSKSSTMFRGLSLLDPDMHANWSIIAGSIIYMTYNVQVLCNYDLYSTNRLYVQGDIVYLFNSICYLLASLRDCGWFCGIDKLDSTDATECYSIMATAV